MGRAFECRRRAKESRWATMSKVFPKLAKSITLAAKNGGPDPESNAPLRVAIANAKAKNLSRENIEAAIKRAAGKDASEIQGISYGAQMEEVEKILDLIDDDDVQAVFTNLA